MKHSTAELIDSALQYYPRGVSRSHDDPAKNVPYEESEEQHRLRAARVEAGGRRGPWRAMMARLREQLPGWDVHDDVYCCPPDALSASYEGWIGFPAYTGPKLTGAEDEDLAAILAAMPRYDRTISFRVSFLVPYYVVYVARTVDDPEKEEAIRRRHEKTVLLWIDNVCTALPREVVKPEILAEIDREFEKRKPATRREVLFDFSPEAQPYATRITREIEATYAYEPMPPEVGRLIVPDVETGGRLFGEATLYDCFFADVL